MTNTTSKIAYLDGIRGVAAFMVFCHHFLVAFYPAYYSFAASAVHLGGWEMWYGHSVLSVLTNGHFCVCIFFVLSGYVLSRNYFLTGKIEAIRSGAARRYFRLYIPVAVTLILSFILLSAHLYYNAPAGSIANPAHGVGRLWAIPDPFYRLIKCLAYRTMFLGDYCFDPVLWTMATELNGSLFVFAFLALTHRSSYRLQFLLLCLLFSICMHLPYLATFVFGISINYIADCPRPSNKYLRNALALALLITALVFGSYHTNGRNQGTLFASLSQYGNKLWFHEVGAYLLIIAFVLSAPLQRIAGLRLFRFLGRISFSLYLLHPLVLGSVSCYSFLMWYPHMGYNQAVMCVFLLTVPVCVFVSWLMAKYIDEPGIRFSKYIYNRWFRKAPTPDSPPQ